MSDILHELRADNFDVADGFGQSEEVVWYIVEKTLIDRAADEIERLRARVEVLEKHLGLMIVNNLTGSFESEGVATDRAIAVLPDWLEKANGYTRLQLDAADEIMKLHVEEAKP